MSLAWNAGWEQSLRGSNPLSSATKISPSHFCEGLIFFHSPLQGPPPVMPELLGSQPTENSMGNETIQLSDIHSPAQLDLYGAHSGPQFQLSIEIQRASVL